MQVISGYASLFNAKKSTTYCIEILCKVLKSNPDRIAEEQIMKRPIRKWILQCLNIELFENINETKEDAIGEEKDSNSIEQVNISDFD